MTGLEPWLALAEEGALAGLSFAGEVVRASRIEGHASRRRFYRLTMAGGGSAILVVVAADEEGEVGRYLGAARWLGAAGVHVPRVLAVGRRALLVQDGGDRLLAGARLTSQQRRRLYRQALEVVVRLQRQGRRHDGPNPCLALDRERLRQELEFFEQHTVSGWAGARTGAAQRARIFDRLAEAVAALPTALAHRDYHSRNLLVDGDRLMVLDFQDLMRGPVLYDVASLIRDDYHDVPQAVSREVLHSFWLRAGLTLRAMDVAAVPTGPSGLPGPARQAFELTALQRSLKALGTFGYQVTVAHNARYAEPVPRTWAHARAAMAALGWDDAAAALRPVGALAG